MILFALGASMVVYSAGGIYRLFHQAKEEAKAKELQATCTPSRHDELEDIPIPIRERMTKGLIFDVKDEGLHPLHPSDNGAPMPKGREGKKE